MCVLCVCVCVFGYLWAGDLLHDLEQQNLVLVPDLVFGVPQSVYEAGQDYKTTQTCYVE